MLTAISDEDEAEQPPPGAQQQQQRPGKVQLSEFWPQAPNAWFAAAEIKFEVAHITGERECFAHAVRAMGFNELCAVIDLVENPPAVDPYTALKGCLVLAHQLMPMQVVASSNQRPSEVLASLLEFCPPGEEGTAFFRAAFTMRLLVAIQAHLAVASTELTHLKELMHRRSWPRWRTPCGCVTAPSWWQPYLWRRTSQRRTVVRS